MWNKKIIVTDHAIKRFEERGIKLSGKKSNVVEQILYDLNALNVILREHLYDNHYKVTTKQGKVYIIIEYDRVCFVKTMYKTSDQYRTFKYLKANERRERNRCRKSNQKKLEKKG